MILFVLSRYLVFYTNKPFYITLPKDWSKDIERYYQKYLEHYAIDPDAANRESATFPIGGKQPMTANMSSMKLISADGRDEYELKRTVKLIGKLSAFGTIEFQRHSMQKKKEYFIYDRRTGYHDAVNSEEQLKIGGYVTFETWDNKNSLGILHHDIKSLLRERDPHFQKRYELLHFWRFLGENAEILKILQKC